MYKITGLNFLLAILYSIIFFTLFNTGYIYASALTTANFKYLLITPFILIIWIFGIGFLWKMKFQNEILIISFQFFSTAFMIMMSLQLIFVSAIFITLTTSAQILLHSINGLMLIIIVVLQFMIAQKQKTKTL